MVSIIACPALEWRQLHEEAASLDVEQARRRLESRPDSLDALYVVGLVYLQQRYDDEAMRVFERILQRDPQSSRARWGKAEVLRREHETAQARALLEDILRQDSSFYPAVITDAFIKLEQGKLQESYREAWTLYRNAFDELDKANKARLLTMLAGIKGQLAQEGGLLAKLNHGLAVRSYLERAYAIDPDSSAVLLGLGSYYLMAPSFVGGDVDKAINYLERAAEVDPRFAQPYARLAQAYLRKGDKARAREFLEQALRLDPQSPLAWQLSSQIK